MWSLGCFFVYPGFPWVLLWFHFRDIPMSSLVSWGVGYRLEVVMAWVRGWVHG